ncbi:MAG: SH3 domain-containing protein [Gammaproteobacteria bacterium]|jgi:uncharacterized protein YgiM (DUF1202 family)|nr:SH3 domain-containing protein [Gammaproteobacteria bacterium]
MKRLGFILLVLPLLSAADVVVPIDSVQNSINIRMSPDTSSEIVGRLKQGEQVTLVESIPGWHEVEIAGGSTGFVSADWSNVIDNVPLSAAADEAVAEATPEETIEKTEDEDRVNALVQEIGVAETVAASDQVGPEESVMARSEETPVAESLPEVVPGDVVAQDIEPADGQVMTPVEDIEIAEVVEESAEATEEVPTQDVVAEAENDSLLDEASEEEAEEAGPKVTTAVPVVVATTVQSGPPGPQGPPGPPGRATVEGSRDFLMKFTAPTIGGNSQIFDDGNNIGIGTTEPKQRLEVNGNIQIHEQNSSVAGLMITQSGGETGYIMHNRASTLTIGAGSIDRITINREGNVGFGVNRPSNPIELASGAHVTAGGVWTNSSSRARKENISELSAHDALETLGDLEPVHFNYKNDQAESYIGFIAEDVPDLVATRDRDGLSAMDIVAVLTKVVQEQQKQIEELEARLDQR